MFLSELEGGSSIFVDANIFIYHFSKQSRFNPEITKFLQRVEEKKVKGITSTYLIQEAMHRMMIIEAASILKDIKTRDLVSYLKDPPKVVKKLVINRSIPEKIASFGLEIISPDINTVVKSQQMKSEYGFLSNDALSLQIMEDLKINNLASNDSDFESVDFITLYRPSLISDSYGGERDVIE